MRISLFNSTLALLRSVCAAQRANILRYVKKGQRIRKEDGTLREVHDIYYNVKELWDVIQPFNSRADYWPALIEGTLEWDEIEVEIPQNGILDLDPEVRRFIVGNPEDYRQAAEEEMRRASFTEEEDSFIPASDWRKASGGLRSWKARPTERGAVTGAPAILLRP